MDSEVWIVFIVFATTFASILSVTYYRHLTKVKKLDTVVKLAESGGEVKPEMLDLLGKEVGAGPTSDLRKGLIWIAIGIPIMLAFVAEGEWVGVAFGTAPLLIGLAYLVVMKFGYQENKSLN